MLFLHDYLRVGSTVILPYYGECVLLGYIFDGYGMVAGLSTYNREYDQMVYYDYYPELRPDRKAH